MVRLKSEGRGPVTRETILVRREKTFKEGCGGPCHPTTSVEYIGGLFDSTRREVSKETATVQPSNFSRYYRHKCGAFVLAQSSGDDPRGCLIGVSWIYPLNPYYTTTELLAPKSSNKFVSRTLVFIVVG